MKSFEGKFSQYSQWDVAYLENQVLESLLFAEIEHQYLLLGKKRQISNLANRKEITKYYGNSIMRILRKEEWKHCKNYFNYTKFFGNFLDPKCCTLS